MLKHLIFVLLACWFVFASSGCDRSAPEVVEKSDDVPAAVSANSEAEESETSDPFTGSQFVAQNGPAADVRDPVSLTPASGALAGEPSGPNVSPALVDQTELRGRPFMTLRPIDSDRPAELIEHLRKVDSALQDLVLAGSSQLLDEATFTQSGLRLGAMKRAAGQRLANAPQASPEERKAGKLAELIALSHMSGLRDAESARELKQFAAELSQSNDPDLAQQSRVVLIGFELQALQNGLRDDPQMLLEQIESLFSRPADRDYPELMVLQQAQQVLQQMGFVEGAEQVRQKVVAEYRNSADPQLRGEAWLLEARNTQAYQNFMQAFASLGTEQFDPNVALPAVRGLVDAFPSVQTLEQIASAVANIEYGGQVELSREVVRYVRSALDQYPDAVAEGKTAVLEQMLADHDARVDLIGKPLPLDGLIGFDGRPLVPSNYEGKVVLVEFWASWCIKCLHEIRNVRELYAELAPQGFEVIGVNMDENLAQAREFVKKQNYAWRSFHSATDEIGFRAPLARRLGISRIPFMVLVGRDGLVKSLHVRGEQLRPAVLNLMFDAELNDDDRINEPIGSPGKN